MEINTKFDIGQKVWYIKNNIVKSAKILSIQTNNIEKNTEIIYKFNKINSFFCKEEMCFATKEEASLKCDIINKKVILKFNIKDRIYVIDRDIWEKNKWVIMYSNYYIEDIKRYKNIIYYIILKWNGNEDGYVDVYCNEKNCFTTYEEAKQECRRRNGK